jgi:hypothetical protein
MSKHSVDVRQLNADRDNMNAFMNVHADWSHVGVHATNTHVTDDFNGGVLVLVRFINSVLVGFYKFDDTESFIWWWLDNSKYIIEAEIL